MRIRTLLSLAAALTAVASSPVAGQDMHLPLPADSMDLLLRSAPFEIRDLQGTRFQGDRTDRAQLDFADGSSFMAQLAPAPEGGEEFNNVPRYELAAYEVQKLFLDGVERVVPPTAIRAFPLDWYGNLDRDAEATFRRTSSVVVLIQGWLSFTTDEDVWDEDRFDSDEAYARNWANLNLFTYLIRHSDSNTGNVRISNFSNNPRLFAVDNGVAFASIDSERGTRWRSLLVDRFPRTTVDRLRGLTEQDFHDALGVMVQWQIEDEQLVPTAPTENLDARRGIRQEDGVIQIGLTRSEIEDIWYRVEVFLGQVDNGTYTTF